MALSNRERVGKALDLLCAGLAPFVERELKAVHGAKWEEVAREGQPAERGKGKGKPAKAGTPAKLQWDTQALLAVVWNQWNTVFSRTLGNAERSIVSELRDVRNKWAHQEAFASNDAYRALDTAKRGTNSSRKPTKPRRIPAMPSPTFSTNTPPAWFLLTSGPGRCGDRNRSGSPLQDSRWRIAGTGSDHHGELSDPAIRELWV